jgi:hypothetical protein
VLLSTVAFITSTETEILMKIEIRDHYRATLFALLYPHNKTEQGSAKKKFAL